MKVKTAHFRAILAPHAQNFSGLASALAWGRPFILPAICLAAGASIYLLPTASMHGSGLPQTALQLLRGYGADALWAFSFGLVMGRILGIAHSPKAKSRNLAWHILSLGCICALESLQTSKVLPGTFDPLDLALELTCYLFSLKKYFSL